MVVIIAFVTVKNYTQQLRAREDKLKSASKSKCKSKCKCKSAGGSTADNSEKSDNMVGTVIEDFDDIDFEDDNSLYVSPKRNSNYVLLLAEEKQTEMV